MTFLDACDLKFIEDSIINAKYYTMCMIKDGENYKECLGIEDSLVNFVKWVNDQELTIVNTCELRKSHEGEKLEVVILYNGCFQGINYPRYELFWRQQLKNKSK